MTMPAMPSRAAIEAADSLTFTERKPEVPLTIRIEVAPDGLHIHAEYQGRLSSIPAALEKLRAAGVLQLVEQHTAPIAPTVAPAPVRQPRAFKKERVEPFYNSEGDACCPVHRKPLQEGQYGLYCPSRASRDEPQNQKGYCSYSIKD